MYLKSIFYFLSDQGDIIGEAESLLQKDYAMAYNEASSALDHRVDDEQRQLDEQRTALVAKRNLKKQHKSKSKTGKPKSIGKRKATGKKKPIHKASVWYDSLIMAACCFYCIT